MVVKDPNSIKLINAALDEDEKGNIIARGVISPESLYYLKVGTYQREVQPKARILELIKAFEDSSVPDIELGMRGGSYVEKENIFQLQNETYIVDGLQRVTAARKFCEMQKIPRLGATIHFNTDEEWERKRFRILNTTRMKLSTNVLLRNMEKESEVIALLLNLCKDKSFVLYEKVSWNQRMNRGELVTASSLVRTTGYLLSRFGPTRGGNLADVTNLERMYNLLGRNIFREDIKTFWDFMDEIYRIKYVTYKEGALFLKAGFLQVMASILADHGDFWQDNKLFIERDLKKKIATFPMGDPEVIRLAGAGGKAMDILYNMIVDHINSGKRTKRLVKSRKNFKVIGAHTKKVKLTGVA